MKPIILPEKKIDELAEKTCLRMLAGNYMNQPVVGGEELKHFSEHQQINKFLLFQVYQIWNMQLGKLRHPFFDFSHPEVQEALNVLKNVLSLHITIKEEDFKPMLKRAIYNNIKLLLDPKSALENFFFAEKDTLTLDTFERYGSFFSDMEFIVNSISRYHQNHNLKNVEKEVFFNKMDKVVRLFDEKRNISFEDYRKGLLQKLTLRRVEDILQEIEREENQVRQMSEEAIRRRNEEEARRMEEERRVKEEKERIARLQLEKEEEERKKQEQLKKQSFFDTLQVSQDNVFDISDDDDLPVTKKETPLPYNKTGNGVYDNGSYVPIEPLQNEQRKPEFSPLDSFDFIQTEKKEPTIHSSSDFDIPLERIIPDIPPVNETQQKKPTTIEEVINSYIKPENKTVLDQISTPKAEPEPPIYTPPVQQPKVEQTKPNADATQNILKRFLVEEEQEPEIVPMFDGKGERPITLAEKFQAQQVNTNTKGKEIKLSDIPIHRQYQYVQKVFEGNNVRFRIIVDKINGAQSQEEVESIIDRFVLNSENLDKNDEAVKEFINLLRSRF